MRLKGQLTSNISKRLVAEGYTPGTKAFRAAYKRIERTNPDKKEYNRLYNRDYRLRAKAKRTGERLERLRELERQRLLLNRIIKAALSYRPKEGELLLPRGVA
jgi:hypothetical protein